MSSQSTHLPEHAMRGPAHMGGPVTGFYQTFTVGQVSVGASSAANTIYGIVYCPYNFIVEDIAWNALSVTGTGMTLQLGHHSAVDFSLATQMVAADIDIAGTPSGHVDLTTTPALQNREVGAGRYILVEVVTGSGDAVDNLSVVITGWCDQHVGRTR